MAKNSKGLDPYDKIALTLSVDTLQRVLEEGLTLIVSFHVAQNYEVCKVYFEAGGENPVTITLRMKDYAK